jgi:hypothetical protein
LSGIIKADSKGVRKRAPRTGTRHWRHLQPPQPQGPGSLPEGGRSACRWRIVALADDRSQKRCLRVEGPLAVGADVAEPDHLHALGVGRPPVVAPAFGAAVRRPPAPHPTPAVCRRPFHFAAAGALSLPPATPSRNGVGERPVGGPSLPLNHLSLLTFGTWGYGT